MLTKFNIELVGDISILSILVKLPVIHSNPLIKHHELVIDVSEVYLNGVFDLLTVQK